MGWKNTLAAVVALAVLFLSCSPASCIELCSARGASKCAASMATHKVSAASSDGVAMPPGHCAHSGAMAALSDDSMHRVGLAPVLTNSCASPALCKPTPPQEATAQLTRPLELSALLLLPATLPLDLPSLADLQAPRTPSPPQAFRQALFALRITRLRV